MQLIGGVTVSYRFAQKLRRPVELSQLGRNECRVQSPCESLAHNNMAMEKNEEAFESWR